jgi:transposase
LGVEELALEFLRPTFGIGHAGFEFFDVDGQAVGCGAVDVNEVAVPKGTALTRPAATLSRLTGEGKAICVLRSYLRYRDDLVGLRSMQSQHMQKALQGDYRPEHLFILQTAFDLYRIYDQKIHLCEEQAMAHLAQLPTQKSQPLPERKAGRKPIHDMLAGTDLRGELPRWAGVDLTAIEGFGVLTAQIILGEIGHAMSRWPSEKHFTSWLGLCPDHRISGGQVLSRHTRRVLNKVSHALRQAAVTPQKSQTALGAFYRRMRGKRGAAAGVTATAHKLARLVYRLLKHGQLYLQQGLEDYERIYRERMLRNLGKTTATFGFEAFAEHSSKRKIRPSRIILEVARRSCCNRLGMAAGGQIAK